MNEEEVKARVIPPLVVDEGARALKNSRSKRRSRCGLGPASYLSAGLLISLPSAHASTSWSGAGAQICWSSRRRNLLRHLRPLIAIKRSCTRGSCTLSHLMPW